LFFFYVGTENAVAGWVAVHADRIEASTLAASMPTVFWGALMIGRGLAPLWLRWTTETAIVLLGLTLAAAGIAVLLGASDLSAVVFGTAMSGLGLAAVFPTTIAQLSREFGETSSRIAAAAFLFASLGGATLPWLVGVWSTAAGDLRRGLLLPLMGCLAMIALHAWRPRARGRTTG
jgi:fucose permease